jgi:hypothetical protein
VTGDCVTATIYEDPHVKIHREGEVVGNGWQRVPRRRYGHLPTPSSNYVKEQRPVYHMNEEGHSSPLPLNIYDIRLAIYEGISV